MELLSEVRAKLKTRNLTALAKACGLSVGTIYAIANGTNNNPGVLTLEAIKKALDDK